MPAAPPSPGFVFASIRARNRWPAPPQGPGGQRRPFAAAGGDPPPTVTSSFAPRAREWSDLVQEDGFVFHSPLLPGA